MAFVSWLAFGTESWQAFFHWMPMFSQAFLTEGKATWWKLQSISRWCAISAAPSSRLGVPVDPDRVGRGGAGADVAQPRSCYPLKAAALAAGALLITPYLFIYDMMVLAIPVAFLVRIGLEQGFRPLRIAGARAARSLLILIPLLGRANRLRRHPDRHRPDRCAASVCGGGRTGAALAAAASA